MTLVMFFIAYLFGLLTATLWAFVWWKRKQVRLACLLTDESALRVRAMKARTFEEAAERCEAWTAASERLEREVYGDVGARR